MMHFCPECGHACYCHGDIDDTVVETEAYSASKCECPFDETDGCARGVEPDKSDYGDDDSFNPTARPPGEAR